MSPAQEKKLKAARLAARDVMLSEFQKIIDQTVLPALTAKLNAHHKVLYGNGKPGIITELAVFHKSVEDQIGSLLSAINGEEGVTARLSKIETWQTGMTSWKNGIVWKVAVVCGFFSGFGAFLGILLDRVGVIHKLFAGG